MSRILIARTIGSIEVLIIEQDDQSLRIEASTTITATTIIDPSVAATLRKDIRSLDVMPIVEQVRDKAHKIAAETDEAKRP